MTHIPQLSIKITILFFCIYFVSQQKIYAQSKFEGFKKASIQEYYSKNTKTKRKYWVSVPNDYQESPNVAYPVIYFFDADNKDLSQIIHNLTAYLAKVGPEMPPAILVGVFQEDRAKDFSLGTLVESKTSSFQDFLREELIPHINNTYRTNNHNIAVGHSMGGAFCFLLATKFPNLFKSYICLSPAFHNWEKETLESFMSQKLQDENFILWKKFYVTYSNYGTMESTLSPFTKSFAEYLASLKNQRVNDVTYFEFISGVGHNLTPIVGVTAGLSYIFKDWKPKLDDLRNLQKGIWSVEEYCKNRNKLMQKVYEYEFQPMAEELNFYYTNAKTSADKAFISDWAKKLYSQKYAEKILK